MTEQFWIATYKRPCFICKRVGMCPHREPLVELAYLHAEPLPKRRPPARERQPRVEKKVSNG